ncbi:MAG: hypothetical protein FJY29_03690 [Betaproteobacteria bacterium]|nr:hypothetical protein [Betaproteobacteria bacterium]
MRNILRLVFACIAFVSLPAAAYRTGIAGGSLGLGNGHSNAADFASPISYRGHFTFKNKLDVSLAATHVLVGRVYDFKSAAFVVPAAGYLADGNGSGPGVSATFGFTFFCWALCLYSEFQQQLGATPSRALVSGYAVRVGIDYTNEK